MADQLDLTALAEMQSGYEAQYDKLRQDLASLQESMEQVAETAFSADGLVSATIGARGELKDLVLDPRIYRITDAKALAESIATAIREATAAVTARMVELTEPMLPEHMRGRDGGFDLDSMLGQLAGKGGDQ
jgi:DNA-binding protein YbaB